MASTARRKQHAATNGRTSSTTAASSHPPSATAAIDDDIDVNADVDTEMAAAARAARLDALLRSSETNTITAASSSSAAPAESPSPSDLDSRASIYAELNSYLDQLQKRVDSEEGFDAESLIAAESDSSVAATGVSRPSTSLASLLARHDLDVESKEESEPHHTNSIISTLQHQPQPRITKLTGSASHARINTARTSTSSSSTINNLTPSHHNNEEKSPSSPSIAEDASYFAGEDPNLPPPDSSFDEGQEMQKIAALDALLLEAETKSAEMEARLNALMAEPLPMLDANLLLLMPLAPEGGSASPANSSDAAGDDFFMTSVTVNDSTATTTSSIDTSTSIQPSTSASSDAAASPAVAPAAASPAAPTPVPAPVDDASLWVLEDVEPLDAPYIINSGEGFLPSSDDQVKLDEIDALLNHFRSSDSKLPTAYRPKFVHPVVGTKRRKRGAAKRKPVSTAATGAQTNGITDLPDTESVTSQPALLSPSQYDDDMDDEETDSIAGPIDDNSLNTRMRALMPPSSSASDALVLSSPSATHESLLSLALNSDSCIEMTKEEQQEAKAWQQQAQKMQKHASSSSKLNGKKADERNAAPVDSEYLRKLLAKTQASASASSLAASSSAAAPASSFPLFSFPKSSITPTTTLPASTDAIFERLEADEKAMKKKQREVEKTMPSGATTATTMNDKKQTAMNGARASRDTSRITSRLGVDDIDSDGAASDVDSDADNDEHYLDDHKTISSNPRVRMDKLAAQVAAIRARVCEEAEGFDIEEIMKEAKKDRDTTATESKASHQQHLHGSGATYSAPSTSASVSLSDRLDRAVVIRPSSSSSSTTASTARSADSWRTWQSRDEEPDFSASATSSTAAKIRAAARAGQTQASLNATSSVQHHTPSPRAPGQPLSSLRTGIPSRPLRAISAAVPSTLSHSLTAMPSQSNLTRRPLSANAASIDLPPPISSNRLQSRQQMAQQALSKTTTWK